MKNSIFKACLLWIVAPSLSLMGLGSCSSDEQEPTPSAEEPEVVAYANFSMGIGGDNEGTRATMSGNALDWQTGDKLVMASNGQVNGTLVCKEVDGDGVATFSGVIKNFTPAGVNIYYLGNREAESMTPSFDFSSQCGTLNKLSSYVFLKKTDVALVEGTGDSYAPADNITFEGMTTLLALTLNPANSPAATKGATATSARIIGMQNCLTVNLADGTVTPSYMKMLDGTTDNTTTYIAPSSEVEYSNTYYLSVIPQNATKLTMQVSYLNTDASTETTLWSNINWDMSAKAGKKVTTNWTKSGKVPTIVESSQKYGYSGQAVEGGENADGLNHKGGYGGSNVGDEADNPQGNKNGYGGSEVL